MTFGQRSSAIHHHKKTYAAPVSFGLLVLRVSAGGMMLVGHGLGKLAGFNELAPTFHDPLGLGTTVSLALATFAEVGCSAALILGLLTRAAALPLIFALLAAAFIVHAGDPWEAKEPALLYLVAFLSLAITGAGRFSLDAALRGRKN